MNRLELLGDDLPRAVDVDTPVEFDPHHRDAGARAGAHPPYARGSVDRGFEGKCHQELYLLWREAVGFGYDGDGWRCEVRENIDWHSQGGPCSVGQDSQSGHDHQKSALNGPADDLVENGAVVGQAGS